MKILHIYTNPDPVLRKKSLNLNVQKLQDDSFKDFFASMKLTMQKKDGVGLAAPQVGKNLRIIAVNTPDGTKILVNPRINKRSWAKNWGEEGCLSVPSTFGDVYRHKKISLDYIDELGESRQIQATNLLARIFQHEIDHLDGVLFIDKAKNIKHSD